MSGAGFSINAELVGKLKAALDVFIGVYKGAGQSWFSSAGWDLHGHHAAQTELFKNLQIALESKAKEAEASDDLNSEFFSQIAALSLIGKIHQIITGTGVESGTSFAPAYAALVLEFEKNLNLVKTPFEGLKKDIDLALNEGTAFAMSAKTSSEDFSIFLKDLESVLWTIQAQEKFGMDLYSDLPDLVADSDEDQESKAQDHSGSRRPSFVVGWNYEMVFGPCYLSRCTGSLLSLLATGGAVADGRAAPVGSRPLAPASMLADSGVMPPLVPSVLTDRPASASVAAAVTASEVVVVEPFVEAAAASGAKKPKAPKEKVTAQQADLMLRAALKAAEAAKARKAGEQTVVMTKQEQKELQDFLEQNRPSTVSKILKSDPRMPRPTAVKLAETQLEKEFLDQLAARKSSGCAAPR